MSYVLLCDRCGAICIWDRAPADRRPLCDPCAQRPARPARPVRPVPQARPVRPRPAAPNDRVA